LRDGDWLRRTRIAQCSNHARGGAPFEPSNAERPPGWRAPLVLLTMPAGPPKHAAPMAHRDASGLRREPDAPSLTKASEGGQVGLPRYGV